MRSLAIIALCIGSAAYSQSVADYSMVSVLGKSKDFSANKYGLESQLGKILAKKNYTVLSSDKFSWPSAAQNPCSVITANILNSSGMLRNKVSVDFRDCNDKSVAKFEGVSLEKEFETGYPDALTKAAAQIPVSKGQTFVQPSAAAPVTHVAEPMSAVQSAVVASDSAAEIFSNANLRLSRIRISGDQFILASPNLSTPYAVFRATTRPDVFRVQLDGGQQTIGYFENNNIVIELPTADGNFRKEVFLRK